MFAIVLQLVAATADKVEPAAPKPNLFFFLADDLGYYDMGFTGNRHVHTPYIDNLVAKESAVLTRHYVFVFCSPTRRSFLSGRFPPHTGVSMDEHMPHGVPGLLSRKMTSIASKLKQAGYVTGHAGKWHLGHRVMAETPHGRGFDTSIGYFQGMQNHYSHIMWGGDCQYENKGHKDFPIDLWDKDKPADMDLWDGVYGDYMYAGRAVHTIEQHNTSAPLFFYLAAQSSHDPVQSPARFQDIYKSTRSPKLESALVGEYAMSSVLDEMVKNVTQALKKKGMWDNTLFIFSSDNGGPIDTNQASASNFPLRGGKYSGWEGGSRAVAFVSGGLLPPAQRGRNITAPIHIADWYATFAKLAGVDPADDHPGIPPIDSVDQWPTVSGADRTSSREDIYPSKGILIRGQYKLIAKPCPVYGCSHDWSSPLFPQTPAIKSHPVTCSYDQPCLYDVVIDAGEHHDIAAAHADLVASMKARLVQLDKTQFTPEPAAYSYDQLCAKTAANGHHLTPADYHHHITHEEYV